jgi:hypothetical protein
VAHAHLEVWTRVLRSGSTRALCQSFVWWKRLEWPALADVQERNPRNASPDKEQPSLVDFASPGDDVVVTEVRGSAFRQLGAEESTSNGVGVQIAKREI